MTIEQMLDSLDWKPVEMPDSVKTGDIPYVTHEGILKLGEMEFRIYRLSNGNRVIDQDDLNFGITNAS